MSLPSYLNTHPSDSPLTVEQVRSDFLNWRRDVHRSKRIPEALWQKVFLLLKRYPKSRVLSAMGISRG